MASSNLDKEIDHAIAGVVKYIGHFFKKVWFGIKKLKSLKNIIGLFVFIAISVIVYMLDDRLYEVLNGLEMPGFVQKIVYIIFLAAPVLYLAILGSMTDRKQEEYNKKFESIGFKGKTGYPVYMSDNKDEIGRITYVFKTDLNLGEWKRKKESLETALDCTIWDISNKGSKKIIQMTAIPSDFELPEMISWNDANISDKDGVLIIGQSILQQMFFDLNKTAHVLIAGATGFGKSVLLRCLLWQMIKKGAKVFMFDFKGGVEFGLDYEQFGEVVTEHERAIEVLEMLVEENKRRLALFRKCRVKNLPEYNKKYGKNLCRIGLFCDEFAEMVDKKGASKEVKQVYEKLEGLTSSLARLSRATGINLFLGMQRPDANVLTGQIKTNIPVRICGKFSDKAASEIVLNNTAAADLPEVRGRFLFQRGNELIEFQSYYFDDETMLDKTVEIKAGAMLIDSPSTDYYADAAPGDAYDRDYAYEMESLNQPAVKDPAELKGNYDYEDVFNDGEITWSVEK